MGKRSVWVSAPVRLDRCLPRLITLKAACSLNGGGASCSPGPPTPRETLIGRHRGRERAPANLDALVYVELVDLVADEPVIVADGAFTRRQAHLGDRQHVDQRRPAGLSRPG